MKAVSLILVLLLVAFTKASTTSDPEWRAWKKEHNKIYSDGLEELKRYNIWRANKERIDVHNANAEQFTLGMNQFGDLEIEEVTKMMMNSYLITETSNKTKVFIPDPNFKAAENVNWTAKGAVTPVGNQGECGSCWAFSATGALEGQHFVKTGKLVSLSEQNLMDCTKKYGNYGCNGGYMKASYEYVRDNGGIDTESSYPYEGKDDSECHFKKPDIGATCTGYVSIPSKDEHALMQAVQSVGPVAVAVDGQHYGFINYKSGVYYDPQCSQTAVDHTLLVVGFGTLNGQEYWLAKNSWGTQWGMNGYIMMARNRENNCGIATLASYPTV